MKLHHIALFVHHLETCSTFYQDVVGLTLLDRKYDEEGKLRSLWLSCGEVILMLEKKKVEKKVSQNVIAFTIHEHERDDWKRKLKKMGILIERESEFSIYLQDPEGQVLALSHYPKAQE